MHSRNCQTRGTNDNFFIPILKVKISVFSQSEKVMNPIEVNRTLKTHLAIFWRSHLI